MRNLPSRLLARLRVSRKLMLIYLLDLSAVIYVSSILISEKYIAIDFARKELSGNAYIADMRDVFVDAARLGSGAPAREPGGSGWQSSVVQAEQRHGAGMHSAEVSAELARALERAARSDATQRAEAVGEALSRGRELLIRVGNQSNLILDPDLDSYYTMSLVVTRYIELLEIVQAMGQRATEAGAVGAVVSNEKTRYLILEGRLDAIAQAIRQDQSEALAAGGPALAAQLRAPLDELARAIEGFRTASRNVVDTGMGAAAPTALRDAQLSVIGEAQHAWAASGRALDALLQQRIDGLFHRMWLHLGTALMLLGVILAIVTMVARSISRPLSHLAGVADTVRRTGDHTLRAHWHSGDEIGRLVLAFNEMLDQLDVERERQKELAASARAAEAQRALVESTPIALVVTAIPGHQVLHANPPAEAWLAGLRTDPWRVGLDAPVRARFFQQLADRDAVDEFEVRWRAGAEPAWAVLSARRVRFEGHDAVLTAFTPINHLKVMERRLELWAKVFQASSEGILIVDGAGRILTINQAFTRATGHDLAEAIGHTPDSLFLDGSRSAGAVEALRQSVLQRGSWSGELAVRRRDGSSYPAWVMASAVREADGALSHTIIISVDITDRKATEARIRYLAEHDVLTGLPNRASCAERLRLALQQAGRTGTMVAVLFIDLDRFKDINDSLGHHIGDALLRSVSRRLLDAVREGDTVSRLGGDEFVVVLGNIHRLEEVTQVVGGRLIPCVRAPHFIDGVELHVSCSVGVAIYPDDAGDIDTLMRHADTAMYQAKAAGRDGAQFFTAEMTERAQARLQLENELRRAVDLQQFVLHWQPRLDAARGTLCGVEGLLRWVHPSRGLVAPGEFIAVLEETGLIVRLGQWVIEEACRQAARWREQQLPFFGVSINLSALQLREAGLPDVVAGCIHRHRLPAGQLELELTESMVMSDAEGHLRQMHALRALGVKLSIDDFGTGYSSLAYLNRLPIDKLKIDRGFVHRMLADPTDRAITLAIIGLGHTLGLKVVAEGVEREAEAAVLRDSLCDELQGFLFARPLPADALADWLRQRLMAGNAAAEDLFPATLDRPR